MNTFKISVIIPAYNAGKYINGAINSVLKQTYQPHEIIVVDDGSRDNTYKIVKDNFSAVSLFRQENGGPAAARNLGIQKSTGDWITFLDADDEWMPDLLENYVEVLVSHKNIVWCCGPYVIEFPDKKVNIRYSGSQLENRVIENILVAYKDFKNRTIAELVTPCSVIINRHVFNVVGYFNTGFKHGEDIDMWFRISLVFPRIGYLDEVSFKYKRYNPKSLTSLKKINSSIKVERINNSWKYIKEYTELQSIGSIALNIWFLRLFKNSLKEFNLNFYEGLEMEVLNNLNHWNKIRLFIIKLLCKIIR